MSSAGRAELGSVGRKETGKGLLISSGNSDAVDRRISTAPLNRAGLVSVDSDSTSDRCYRTRSPRSILAGPPRPPPVGAELARWQTRLVAELLIAVNPDAVPVADSAAWQ
jgi:hypothetical protein